jgi:hypothetical protein
MTNKVTVMGEFALRKRLKPSHAQYLQAFASTKRVRRYTAEAMCAAGKQFPESVQPCDSLPDPVRVSVDLPIGPDGAYFVGGGGFAGTVHDPSVLDAKHPPKGQPSLWCPWEPNEEGTAIVLNGAGRGESYLRWLWYLIDHFLSRWGYTLKRHYR